MPVLINKSSWIATYEILPDGKVTATITDQSGIHRSENQIFASLEELKKYMASKP